MIEYIVIPIVALLGSGLTLFSGFGLGTILVPVFGLFFSIELAIVLTAIVHFLNNIFKLFLVGKKAHRATIIKFGIPSIIFSFIGAYTLTLISSSTSIAEYHLFNSTYTITPVKLIIALLLFTFAIIEIVPRFKKIEFDTKYLPIGGILSGFFGGLSGNQGALRTMFLIKSNLTKEAFIGTGVVLACLIDVSRLSVYLSQISKNHHSINYLLLIIATLFAFLGAYLGNKLIKKVTISFIQNFVSIMILLFSMLLGLGII